MDFGQSGRAAVALCSLTFLLIAFAPTIDSVRWLSLAGASSLAAAGQQDLCQNIKGLERKQKVVCQRHKETMPSVIKGANMSVSECQHQFQNRRWNCSTVDQESIFGNILNQGTREAAFVHAIAAAGVAHAVTMACSRGELAECGCDKSTKERSPDGYTWGGCSDNVAFGSMFSKTFTDARERTRNSSARALMNLHNNEAGRKAVEESMRTECKCHGVSGSCEMRSCWRALPAFRTVGLALKDKFDGATEVKARESADGGGRRRSLVPVNAKFKPQTPSDLVYLVPSPDFCDADPSSGSLGTRGRKCDRQSKGVEGCDLMCCDRGFVTKKRKHRERCDCKFHWCCYVACEDCETEVEENFCQ